MLMTGSTTGVKIMDSRIKLWLSCLIIISVSLVVYHAVHEERPAGLVERSPSLRELIECVDVSDHWKCLSRYRSGVIAELFPNADNKHHHLHGCLNELRQVHSSSLMGFQLSECLHLDMSEQPQTARRATPRAVVLSVAAGILLLVLCLFLSIEWLIGEEYTAAAIQDEEPLLAEDLNHSAVKDPISAVKGEEESSSSLIINLESPTTGTLTNNSLPTAAGRQQHAHHKTYKGPTPSALHFPQYNKDGKKHRRIFIPGRGWMHRKQLELEQRTLAEMLN